MLKIRIYFFVDFSGYWSLIFKLPRKTFFEPFLNVAIHLGWILSIFYIRTHISINIKYNKTEVSTISMFWWFSSVLGFLIQPVYSSDERSQSISLDDSGIPLSNVNIQSVSKLLQLKLLFITTYKATSQLQWHKCMLERL